MDTPIPTWTPNERPQPLIGWAILELLGHRRETGFVTEEEIAGAKFIRLATPVWDPEREDWRPEGEEGSVRVAFFSTQAVYAITPTTETAVRDEVAPWIECREPVNAPDLPSDTTCVLRKGHVGDHAADALARYRSRSDSVSADDADLDDEPF